MSLTLKIAAGVFLGILAILIVLKIPSWINDYREDDAASRISSLTPEEVIVRCGRPLRDETEKLTDSFRIRRLIYKGNILTILLTFNQVPKETGSTEFVSSYPTVTSTLRLDGLGNSGLASQFESEGEFKTAREKIYWLPCLGAK